MSIVRVQKKGQVTLPIRIRTQVGIVGGDLLDVKFERGKITLTPKCLIDQRIAESMEDYERGRFYGPFDTADQMIASLKRNLRSRAKRAARTR